jgi:hypothetical protein
MGGLKPAFRDGLKPKAASLFIELPSALAGGIIDCKKK